jgi:hypothetical protein
MREFTLVTGLAWLRPGNAAARDTDPVAGSINCWRPSLVPPEAATVALIGSSRWNAWFHELTAFTATGS